MRYPKSVLTSLCIEKVWVELSLSSEVEDARSFFFQCLLVQQHGKSRKVFEQRVTPSNTTAKQSCFLYNTSLLHKNGALLAYICSSARLEVCDP